MDSQNQEGPVILIYHNFRGLAQNIRFVLYYLEIPFHQRFVKKGQNLNSINLPQIKKSQVENQLPCLIDQSYIIQDSFAIIRHLCTKAKRQDLLGQNLEQRTLIRQIYYYNVLKKKKSIKSLFEFGVQAVNCKCPMKKEQLRKCAMIESHKNSGSLVQLSTMKMQNPGRKYIFNHITILDFLFYEDCFYQINMFGNLEQKNCKILETLNSILGTQWNNIKQKSSLNLKTMRQFKQMFQAEPFYVKNKDQIQSYSVLFPYMSQCWKKSFQQVWIGPQKFLK